MSDNREIKRIPKAEVMHPDLWRLAKSLRAVLIRKYPDAEERKTVANEIMQKVVAQNA